MKIKVLAVFGTRPEAIKMAPLVRLLKESREIKCTVAVTAQHREMLDQVLSLFNIIPEYDLDIMKERQSLSDITSAALKGLEKVICSSDPDIVLVHGDTTTTLAASLAAFYQQKRVGHVEAGLRTGNKWFPFPEEINRKLTGSLADIHFAPTRNAKENLIREGVEPEWIFVTGNTVIDALKTTVDERYVFSTPLLNVIDYKNRKVVLVTAHRRENFGQPLENICMAIRDLVEEFPEVEVIYPVHYNPSVRDTVFPILGDVEKVHLIDPLDTREMHNLINKSYFLLTDSGGLQEEAPALGKPVLVLRDVTERPEGVDAGTVRVIGTCREGIFKEAVKLLADESEYRKMSGAINPYGDGYASERIYHAILYYFGLEQKRPQDFIYESTGCLKGERQFD